MLVAERGLQPASTPGRMKVLENFCAWVMREVKRRERRAPPGASWSALAERSGDSACERKSNKLQSENFRAGASGGALRWPPLTRQRLVKIHLNNRFFRNIDGKRFYFLRLFCNKV